MKNASSNNLVALGLVLAVVFIAFLLSPSLRRDVASITGYASSQTPASQASVNNAGPTAGPCYVSSSLAGGPGTSRFWCNCTVVDTNGFGDIAAVNATIFNYTYGEAGAASNLFHYTNNSCRTYNGALNTIHANCSFDVQYYVSPGTWQCRMYFNDTQSASTNNLTNFTIATVLAITNNLTTVNYGSVSPGSNSSAVPDNVTNWGNIIVDTKFEATNLTSAGNKDINASNQQYSFGYNGTYLDFAIIPNSTGVANASYNLNFSYDGTTGSANKTQYFLIAIDSGQPSGTYTGVITITASDGR
ncbi:hypothetical protein HY995_02795 [Candidatus Micrarchaeota archaeon]|nr:hypothetical protein [Candidatus Micrarchaeota archaeon]